MHIALSIL